MAIYNFFHKKLMKLFSIESQTLPDMSSSADDSPPQKVPEEEVSAFSRSSGESDVSVIILANCYRFYRLFYLCS